MLNLALGLEVQEVPGSNPGSPTNPFNQLQTKARAELAVCGVLCDVTAYWTVSDAVFSMRSGCEIMPPESLSKASRFAAMRAWL
jgi:hypothetical protein